MNRTCVTGSSRELAGWAGWVGCWGRVDGSGEGQGEAVQDRSGDEGRGAGHIGLADVVLEDVEDEESGERRLGAGQGQALRLPHEARAATQDQGEEQQGPAVPAMQVPVGPGALTLDEGQVDGEDRGHRQR